VHRQVVERLLQEVEDPVRFERLRRFIIVQGGPRLRTTFSLRTTASHSQPVIRRRFNICVRSG
jgi:hypothetical protein